MLQLRGMDSVVIVGASGWATRAAEFVLTEKLSLESDLLKFYGSHPRAEEINCKKYNVKEWVPQKLKAPTSLFLPLGFLTVDKYLKWGRQEFEDRNRQLIQKSVEFIKLNEPERCILISSGIVDKTLDLSPRKPSYLSYAKLKSEEEDQISRICQETKTKIVICRLFSASGRHIVDPNRYALGNFVVQGILTGKIEVKSNGFVLRRYFDMGQLIEICIKASEKEGLTRFDSGGELIEVTELAEKVAHHLGSKVSARMEEPKYLMDSYFSKSSMMEDFAEELQIRPFSISKQIEETIIGVKFQLQKQGFFL